MIANTTGHSDMQCVSEPFVKIRMYVIKVVHNYNLDEVFRTSTAKPDIQVRGPDILSACA